MSIESRLNLSVAEKLEYDSLFASADADADGVIGRADATWFTSLDLPKPTLGKIWELSDVGRRGCLTKESFYLAMRLVSLATRNQPLSLEAACTAPPYTTKQPATDPSWEISAAEIEKFEEVFAKADDNNDGFVTGDQARKLFQRSKLGLQDLGKIWALSDVNQDRKLDREEFIIAMFLINAKIKGRPLPDVLPPSLHPSVLRKPPPEPSSPFRPPVPTRPVLPAFDPNDPWSVPPQEKDKYEVIFKQADSDEDGYVTGDQARKLFGRSNLPLEDLATIWQLSDIDQDRKLNKIEFIIAMFLINKKIKGTDLPATLPPNLLASIGGGGSTPSSPSRVMPNQVVNNSPPPKQPTPTQTPIPDSPLPTQPQPIPAPSSPQMSPYGRGLQSGMSPTGSTLTPLSPIQPLGNAPSPYFPSPANDGFESQLNALEADMQKTRMNIEDIKNLAKQHHELVEKKQKVLQQAKEKSAEASRLLLNEEAHLAELQNELQALDLKIQTEEANSAKFARDLQLNKEKSEGLMAKKESLVGVLAQHQAQVKEEEALNKQIEAEILEKENSFKELNSQIKKMSTTVTSLQTKRTELKSKLGEINKRYAKKKKEITKMQEQAKSLNQEVVSLDAEVSRAEEREKELDSLNVSSPVSPASTPDNFFNTTTNADNDFFGNKTTDTDTADSDTNPFGSFFGDDQNSSSKPGTPTTTPTPQTPTATPQNFFSNVGQGLDTTITQDSFGSVGSTDDFFGSPSAQTTDPGDFFGAFGNTGSPGMSEDSTSQQEFGNFDFSSFNSVSPLKSQGLKVIEDDNAKSLFDDNDAFA